MVIYARTKFTFDLVNNASKKNVLASRILVHNYLRALSTSPPYSSRWKPTEGTFGNCWTPL